MQVKAVPGRGGVVDDVIKARELAREHGVVAIDDAPAGAERGELPPMMLEDPVEPVSCVRRPNRRVPKFVFFA